MTAFLDAGSDLLADVISAETGARGADPAPAASELATGLVSISAIRGVPLQYERSSAHAFLVARSFLPYLEAIVDSVRHRVPASYGALQRISSAGMYVAKPGRHGEGRACDWDRLTFAHVSIAPIEGDHASPDLARRRRYWAFVALCRSHCCYTLHGRYNRDHENHVHCDNSTGVEFNANRSTVTLLQALLNDVHGAAPALTVDGVYGPRTRAATAVAIARLGLSGDVHERAVWLALLRRSARLGFALSAPVHP